MALKSMTGFGAATRADEDVELQIEIKSVNNRFLDVSVRNPSIYSKYEGSLQALVKEKLGRGRVDVSIYRKDLREPEVEVVFNANLFKEYLSALDSIESGVSKKKLEEELCSLALSKREVLELVRAELDESEAEQALLEECLTAALGDLLKMREKEGELLQKEVESLLSQLEGSISDIEKIVSQSTEAFRVRLSEKLEKIRETYSLDEGRIAQEVALLAEKADISEEIARLESHFIQFRAIVEQDGGGRKLDFLLQEFLRECNTIGSKSQSAEIAALVVDAKSSIEKLKEQIANIE